MKDKVLAVYGKGSATSWSAGWRFLGTADSIEDALAKYPDATFIKADVGEPNEKCVWTSTHGAL